MRTLGPVSAQFPQAPLVVPNGHRYGFLVSNNGTDAVNDLDIAAGSAASDVLNNPQLMQSSVALVKQLDVAWAAGTNAGLRDPADDLTGAKTFHVYAIKRLDTGVVDVFASTSLTPSLPSPYSHKRRIESIKWDGSTIVAFSRHNDEVLLKDPPLVINVTDLGTSAVLYDVGVPNGKKFVAILNLYVESTGGRLIYMSSPDVNDEAPSQTVAPLITLTDFAGNDADAKQYRVRTNASKQVRARANAATTTIKAALLGWLDPLVE